MWSIRHVYSREGAHLEVWPSAAPEGDFTLPSADLIHATAARLLDDGPYLDGGCWYAVPILYLPSRPEA